MSIDRERTDDTTHGGAPPPGEPHPPGHQAHGQAPPVWQAPGPSPVPEGQPAGEPANEERTWALFAHLSALAGFFIPFGQVLGPLVVWILRKDVSPFVAHQGKEAVNFQITMLLLMVIAGVLLGVGIVLSFILIGIPILVLSAMALGVVYLLSLIFAIVGAVKANEGQWYRYPFNWRFIQ